jgi:HMG (high mobility group) box
VPKRPLSAYMYFAQDRREATKQEHPRAKFGELGKILGAAWNSMDAGEKKVGDSSLLCRRPRISPPRRVGP